MLLAGKMGYPRVTRSRPEQESRRTMPAATAKSRNRKASRREAAAALSLGGAPPARRRPCAQARRGDPCCGAGVPRARLSQHLARRSRRQPQGHQAHALLICAQQGSHPVRVLPGGPRADPGDARRLRARRGPGARAAVRLHPRICRGYCRGLRLVHAARRRPAPRHRDEPAHQTTQGAASIAACARSSRPVSPTARSAPATPEHDGLRAGRRAQLDGPLVSRGRHRSSPSEIADRFIDVFNRGLRGRD